MIRYQKLFDKSLFLMIHILRHICIVNAKKIKTQIQNSVKRLQWSF